MGREDNSTRARSWKLVMMVVLVVSSGRGPSVFGVKSWQNTICRVLIGRGACDRVSDGEARRDDANEGGWRVETCIGEHKAIVSCSACTAG